MKSDIENLKEIIESHRAKRVLFLSSELVKPTFEQCLAESRLFGDSQLKINIEIPKNSFFGGNLSNNYNQFNYNPKEDEDLLSL